jgi:uncharacterized protein
MLYRSPPNSLPEIDTMRRTTQWICWGLILAGWLWAAARAPAQGKNDPPRRINDEAHLFSKDAIHKAENEIADIKKKYRKDLLIETREQGPPGDEYEAWAKRQAEEHRIDGIYIIITRKPAHLQVEVNNATLASGKFTTDDRKHVRQIFQRELGKNHDRALLDAVDYVATTLKANSGSTAATPKVAAPKPIEPPGGDGPNVGVAPPVGKPGGEEQHQGRGGLSWLGLGGLGVGGFICLALVAIAVIWVVIGLVRSMFRPRYPAGGVPGGAPGGGYAGGGYAPGYGGYGGGGGGGGFLSSLFGGMFGAAAGMWMYNNLFGGHSSGGGFPTNTAGSGFGGGGYYGGTAPDANANAGTQPSDASSGYSGEGGDWGGDSDKDRAIDKGGDDAGGGDWGGGGDAGGEAGAGGDVGGGGGDGGGGGGDWGGGDAGGGGDWGGGGGGDFGGGGGDFGGGGDGGGGGGDW